MRFRLLHQSTSSFLDSRSFGKRRARLAVMAMPKFNGDDLGGGPKRIQKRIGGWISRPCRRMA